MEKTTYITTATATASTNNLLIHELHPKLINPVSPHPRQKIKPQRILKIGMFFKLARQKLKTHQAPNPFLIIILILHLLQSLPQLNPTVD